MPTKLGDQKIEEIIALHNHRIDPAEIAATVNCHPCTVYQILRNIRFFGSPRAPSTVRGRPRKVTKEIADALEDYYTEYQTNYLDEAVAFVKEEFGVQLNGSTVWRVLKSFNSTRKIVSILLL
jgi:transposase